MYVRPSSSSVDRRVRPNLGNTGKITLESEMVSTDICCVFFICKQLHSNLRVFIFKSTGRCGCFCLHHDNPVPCLVGGDFNIIRRQDEKNNENFNRRWSFMFNMIIESLDLREVELSGRQFTWANSLPIPTYEKLDRVLTSVEWEQKFSLVTVRAL